MEIDFDEEKNKILLEKRGISFYQIIEAIADKGVLLNIEHPNKEIYSHQKMFVVEYENYTYCVPYVIDRDKIFLKTIFPNRDYLYLLSKEETDDE